MLYPKNESAKLSTELFENPTSEYRGAPFWAWNCKLDKDLLLREIDQLKEMGMGGFHIHCRSGLATEYLGTEYMQLVADCNEHAKQSNMLCWLYDEDRWPSGAAGGLVTKTQEYRSRYLVFSPSEAEAQTETEYDSSARAVRSSSRKELARYAVSLCNGYLASYRRLNPDEHPSKEEDVWIAFLEISGNNPWFNNQAYVNTLDPKAIQRFVEETHEKYYRALGSDFGKSIPAIFTDEPQFSRKECLDFAAAKKDVILPFTDDFDETYSKAYGESILDRLPELIWELPENKVSLARYQYHDHISERFAAAFADTIGSWCKEHGIMLTGHMMEEPTLHSQTAALGDCMRSYRSFQLPGIDILCDRREFTTAKQAASAAHQFGRPGVTSELYGVTNWDFDFRGHKLQGDWQAALGVTVRVHHLNWVSMAGEAKRDYPAAIGYQSPWYKQYGLIENHFSRLNTALTRGKPHVRVGVIHPVESYWLHWGPKEQTSLIREELDENFQSLAAWLLNGLIDFDYISESLLPIQSNERNDGKFGVGEMAYDVVLVPGCETLRSSTLDCLERFHKAGGSVLFAGTPARYTDAKDSTRPKELAEKCVNVPFTRSSILGALNQYRDIDILNETGARADNLLYQMRCDGNNRWMFICHAEKTNNPDIAKIEELTIRIKGSWKPTIYNTMTGEILPVGMDLQNGMTVIRYNCSIHDSLLLLLEPAKAEAAPAKTFQQIPDRSGFQEILLPEPNEVNLSEPNVLLLDMAEYAFDGGAWQSPEELLRIDNKFRGLLRYPMRMGSLAQPYTMQSAEKPEHLLSLRFTVNSQVELNGTLLALENPENTTIVVNGKPVKSEAVGFYTDESIKTVKLPTLNAGSNEIQMHIPFTPKTNVECCYLLGGFSVTVMGKTAEITGHKIAPVFGDWVCQGLPFYGGNVLYNSTFGCKKGRVLLEVSHFRSPLLRVSLDNTDKGAIAFAPYLLDLGELEAGCHKLTITAFGNRFNTFGTVHNSDPGEKWAGPDAWRTTGNKWSYEYQLKPTGILTTPRLWIENK